MLPWTTLLHLGDLGVTMPAAAAVAAALAARGAWLLAWRWCWLFGLGMLVVGASKIAYMSWGSGLPQLDFKAISGHAAGATAVFPPLFYLGMLHWQEARYRHRSGRAPRPKGAGGHDATGLRGAQPHGTTGLCGMRAHDATGPTWATAGGLALGMLVAALLVAAGEHSLAEAVAGVAVGSTVSLYTVFTVCTACAVGTARKGGGLPPFAPLSCLLWVGLAVLATVLLMRRAHVGYWMIKVARLLAGNNTLHTLSID